MIGMTFVNIIRKRGFTFSRLPSWGVVAQSVERLTPGEVADLIPFVPALPTGWVGVSTI